MNTIFQVRIDYIKHLVPAASSGKKEWYVIGISRNYEESDTFIGFEHLPDVFLTPEIYATIRNHITVGSVLDPVVDIATYNGKMQLRVTGFKF